MRKTVKEAIVSKLEKEGQDLNYKIRMNKRKIKALVEEQEILKRSRGELQKLINSIKA